MLILPLHIEIRHFQVWSPKFMFLSLLKSFILINLFLIKSFKTFKNTESILFSVRVLNSLRNLLRLLLCGGSSKEVKVNLEPFVDAGVNSVVLVTDLLGRQALLSSLVLGSCAVLIRATDKQHVPPSQVGVSGKR